MNDRVETICGSLVQHGHHSDRIYVMHLNPEAAVRLIPVMDQLAVDRRYGKITAKIPASSWKAFCAAGYRREATVPGFFSDRTDGLFVAKFFSSRRQRPELQTGGTPPPERPEDRPWSAGQPLAVSACSPADADSLSRIYDHVFESYPFPIDRPQYLKKVMKPPVFYYCVRINQRMVAAAAAETDPADLNCEMTDFATLPAYRSNGLAGKLLKRLHDQARRQGLKIAYTIARADSPGMNRVFKKRGYRFAGRLVKNTQIGGRIRSMNVWYRRL